MKCVCRKDEVKSVRSSGEMANACRRKLFNVKEEAASSTDSSRPCVHVGDCVHDVQSIFYSSLRCADTPRRILLQLHKDVFVLCARKLAGH